LIPAIESITGLNESQIKEIWEFEVEQEELEDEDPSDIADREAKLAEKLAKKEFKAIQKAEERIAELEQKIEQLEKRLQSLLSKVETGEYFGPVPIVEESKSYGISFDGVATSLDDDTIIADVSGEVFIENLVTGKDTSKFRVTSGEILIGDTFYDLIFGKARVTSSGPSGEKDSMILIGQIMDDDGNVTTIRLSLDSPVSFSDESGLEPVEVEINMQRSKVAHEWSLSGSGQISVL